MSRLTVVCYAVLLVSVTIVHIQGKSLHGGHPEKRDEPTPADIISATQQQATYQLQALNSAGQQIEDQVIETAEDGINALNDIITDISRQTASLSNAFSQFGSDEVNAAINGAEAAMQAISNAVNAAANAS